LAQKRYVDLSLKENFQLFEIYNKLEGNAINYPPIDFLFKSMLMILKLSNFRLIALYTMITVYAYTSNIFFFYSLLLLDALVSSE
jgi:hypothetical protein